MTQIVNKRTTDSTVLSTLGNGSGTALDDIYATLLHKAFLFEYRAQFIIETDLVADYFDQGGIVVALVKQPTTDAEFIIAVDGAQITDEAMHTEVPLRQNIFALAEIRLVTFISATEATLEGSLSFKPKSKGGIPFVEGSGWQLKCYNNTGSGLTAGNTIGPINIYERFAYEGGSL